ncbi:MAG: hypothetical protein KIT81_05815 [Alphaproteobacteria bacterium]|nr:hypothetical protein [Alphaproteobacteria bacterium]
MSTDYMNYSKMVEDALRLVAREALERVAALGLPGNHHFYISFRTAAPGVQIPAYLRERYPDEMTIVLQHQFHGLEVGAEDFSVTLSFNRTPERLTIPYAAMTSFADPSVQFGLQFRAPDPAAAAQRPAGLAAVPAPATPAPPADGPVENKDARERKGGEVVTLDAFRKK